MRLSAELDRQQQLEAKRARLSAAAEPAAGTDGVTQLRVQLPSGKRLERRFHKTEVLALLRDFVDVELAAQAEDAAAGEKAIERYSLSTNYPRRTFKLGAGVGDVADPDAGADADDDLALTFDAAGLCPRAALFLADADA